ncbi:DUF3900 domain-containing protein [Geomicrobium sediminis]|uniref:DUF3898 domain-containing protein n=1 Tax=Geomicrobium sediminis TaxID=1347788 RepID=A0ABS2PCY0_9BACL|nr:hypothetical protein [Geomicrobium sediminis]
MEFTIKFLSFYVITVEGSGDDAIKRFEHFQTFDTDAFEESELKDFLDGELKRIVNRKAEHHPKSEQTPTKIGRFITEADYPLDSNPNYALFQKTLRAETSDVFRQHSEEFAKLYTEASAVRGGVFLVMSAVPKKYYSDEFVFILKCDFEQKVASVTDSSSLLKKIEYAITTKNMKSIQYPFMIEEGMVQAAELKIHQSSHARYFQDFLAFVQYGDSVPTLLKSTVKEMMTEHISESFDEGSEEKEQWERSLDEWQTSDQREITEQLSTHQVIEASAQIVEQNPDAEIRMKIGETEIKGPLAEFGESIHIAKVNDRYMLVVEADHLSFQKGATPIEFYKPEDLMSLLKRIQERS